MHELESAAAQREKIENKLSTMEADPSISKSKLNSTQRELEKAKEYERNLNVFKNKYDLTIKLNENQDKKNVKKVKPPKI